MAEFFCNTKSYNRSDKSIVQINFIFNLLKIKSSINSFDFLKTKFQLDLSLKEKI